MSRWTLIVTCAAPDAVPFLRGLPADDLAQANLIVTPHLADAIGEQLTAADVCITAGASTLAEVRRVAACSKQPIAIVIGPDPGDPLRCKGLVRARLLAPWALAPSDSADLIEIKSGGAVGRVSTGLTRGALFRRLYVREGLRLVGYAGVATPMVLITLARLLPFIVWTEARARFMAPQS